MGCDSLGFCMKGVMAEIGAGVLLSFKHRSHLSCRLRMACRKRFARALLKMKFGQLILIAVVLWSVSSDQFDKRCEGVPLGEVALKEPVNERKTGLLVEDLHVMRSDS